MSTTTKDMSSGGGGVDVYGIGADGLPGTIGPLPPGGFGGSGGYQGEDGGRTGLCGGSAGDLGAGGGTIMGGGGGVCRLMWGGGRSFPDNAAVGSPGCYWDSC